MPKRPRLEAGQGGSQDWRQQKQDQETTATDETQQQSMALRNCVTASGDPNP